MAEMQAVGAARPPAWADASSSVVTCPSKAFSPSSSRRARATALSCQAQRASDARRAREPVRDHPGAKAGPGDRPLGGEERVGLGVGGQGTQTVQSQEQSGRPGRGRGWGSHSHLPPTPRDTPSLPSSS